MDAFEFNLPEKAHFTVSEIADRWQCDETRVMHYIDEGLLRPAVREIDFGGLKLFCVRTASEIEEKAGRSFFGAQWGGNNMTMDAQTIWDSYLWEIPKYLYLNVDRIVDFGMYSVTSLLEDLEGYEYGLIDVSEPEFPAKMNLDRFVSRSNTEYKFSRLPYYCWDAKDILITQEERVRFESAHRKPAVSSSDLTEEYETPYLEVMREAINEFFMPRKVVDAKSDEVVKWIAGRLNSVGLQGSKRIAHAMFTIIKPVDHNPRKRRG